MTRRSIYVLLAALIAAAVSPAAAQADGKSPFTLGIGTYIPTSPASSVEGFAPAPGTSVSQHGQLSLEVSFGRDIIPGGYAITAMLLEQKQTATFMTISGQTVQANENFTQVPLMIEGGGTQVGPIRFGGGLGYDFVSKSKVPGVTSSPSGIVGDTFLEVGVGSGAALEAKYFFGQRAALSGVYVGIKTRL